MSIIPENTLLLFMPYLLVLWQVFKHWWWILPPFLLWKNFLYYYLYWRIEKWDATQPRILLEIKIPEQIVKPIKAMEQVFAGFHAIHDVFNWREKWIEGQYQLKLSFEIASIEGKIHFFIRLPKKFRNIIESNIYAQYPEVEITEVSDYTLNVPQDIPNKEWDLWGADQINTKPDPYPIKTYIEFESEHHEGLEEKRIDPLSNLLEGMSTLKEGEHLWLQIIVKPVREQDKDWVKEGLKIRDELIKRPAEKKKKSIIQEVIDILIFGPQKKQESKEETIPPEMKLTPGERELVSAIERKITKFGFDCNIRYIYIAKRSSYFGPRPRLVYSFFKALSYEDLGGFKPNKRTITKSKSLLWFLDERKVYLRKRRMFRFYRGRLSPYFPLPGGTYVLNTEELATLYHFPSRIVAPTSGLSRIDIKKEAPPDLPTG